MIKKIIKLIMGEVAPTIKEATFTPLIQTQTHYFSKVMVNPILNEYEIPRYFEVSKGVM